MATNISDTDIAVVGVALRVPGAATAEAYWNNLRAGVESIRRYEEDELIASGERVDLLRRPNYVPCGAPLEKMELFDGEFFGFSPKEAAILDPQHRHFLECAWESLEDAAHPPDTFGGTIGVFAGCGMGSYFYFNLCSNPDLVGSVGMFLLRHTGNDKDFLSTRASYLFNLRGPSINVQTACSTSLVAVHLGVQSLLSGECDIALAGGVTIELPHRRGYTFQEREILSPDGKCHAFDHRAQGTVFGSGVGVVTLRRLKDALADRDHVYAVIKGSAVNNDGATKAGYLAPSVDGQAAAVAEALAVANVTADTIDYVECHGTGTYLGDPLEVAALTQAFRETTDAKGYCRIGSVKTNIGHLDTAAGVASLIKACMALKHAEMPPSLNFEKPNPTIDFEGSPFLVADRLLPWPRRATPRRACVNSLGVGGTNAHVVLEEAPAVASPAAATRSHQLLALSARNRAALDAQCERLADCLEKHPEYELADVSHTLLVGRRTFAQRRVLSAATKEEAIRLLRGRDTMRVFNHATLGERANVVFMFPGGGAQYVSMARGLYETEATFKELVDKGLAFLRARVDYDPARVLFAEGDEVKGARTELLKPSVQLPLLFILEFALAKLWMAYGVKPSALIGHSLGENTAAAVSGVMTFEQGIELVLLRGRLFDSVKPGGMLSVPMSAEALKAVLGDELDLACINGPELCVASGPNAALERLRAELAERGVEASRIPIDIAAHSRMLSEILEPFRTFLRTLPLKPPEIPFISNRSGAFITNAEATSADYWVDHLRHTVRYADGIATLAEDGARIFLEVGPGKTLGSLAKQNSSVKAQSVLPTLRHQDEVVDDRAFFTTVFGRLWSLGLALDPKLLWPGEERSRISLPAYAFQGQHYWIEPGQAAARGADEALPMKDPAQERWFYVPRWRQREVEPDEAEAKHTWLVFLDEAGVGRELSDDLRSAGHDVITVSEGDAFYKLGDNEYRLSPEQGLEGYEALVRELLASGKAPSRIVHLWLVTDREVFRPGSSFFHRNQERGFFSLLFLAQALGGQEYPKPLHLTIVTSGMQRVRDEALPYPEKATALGPGLVIPRELPGVSASVVDIALPQAPLTVADLLINPKRSAALSALVSQRFGGTRRAELERREIVQALGAELHGSPTNEVVALRGSGRWVRSFERAKRADGEIGFKERGTYVITGGFGGIGLVIARHLATNYRARLVLLGRSPLPARGDWQSFLDRHPNDPQSRRIREVLALEALGSEVEVAAADVTDVERLERAFVEAEGRFGRIDGVVHAAGVLRDQPMLGKPLADIEAVFGPKVYGTLVLEEALKKRNPDFLVLFSSTSAVTAPPGQVDYVAANSFLNAIAARAASEGRRTIALAWGVWQEVGMAADAARQMTDAGRSKQESAAVAHPLLETRSSTARGAHELTGRWSTESHWVLDDHRTGTRDAVLPGTGYIELVRAVIASIERGEQMEIQDLYFFRPLHVPDGEIKRIRITVTPDERGYEVVISSARELENGAVGWERHAQAKVSKVSIVAPAALDLPALDRACQTLRLPEDARGIRTGQEDHLNFGARWRVLRSANFGKQQALARLELPERFAHDLDGYKLHPALLDLATGFAMELIPGYDRKALWVPVSYESVQVYRALPARIWSWVRRSQPANGGADFTSFDVTITNDAGEPCVVVRNFTIKRLEDSAFAVARAPTRSELDIETTSDGERELSPAQLAFQHSLAQGITPEEGMAALGRVLRSTRSGEVIVSSMDLGKLQKQASATLVDAPSDGQKFARPQLESQYLAPRDDIERTLVEFWEELLGVDKVGVRDSFFDLGGHSLVAVRLFAKVKRTYRVDYPISVLFEAPTIEQCAAKLREVVGDQPASTNGDGRPQEQKTRYAHLVKMQQGAVGSSRPFFIVAGMFGNVLNLRHLAQLIGTDRSCYGLQARGLYGDHQPHETFEEMARDYLAELRTVQPEGPYLLGGFSGGGIAAYEMARQLIEQGESVSLLAMLDTPLPRHSPLTRGDRLEIRLQDLKREKAQLVLNWARAKIEYHRHLKEREKRLEVQKAGESHDFHSQVIEAAFYRALAKYEIRPLPVPVALFRPALRVYYRLSRDRMLDRDRQQLFHDNGWNGLVTSVQVTEVPGDHDSMVLEPNVRVLAARLREAIQKTEEAEQGDDADRRQGADVVPLRPVARVG